MLVTGGPGAGKTTIALLKARMRIEEGLLSGQSVLFLSFSRAAVARVVEASQAEVPKTSETDYRFTHSTRSSGRLFGDMAICWARLGACDCFFLMTKMLPDTNARASASTGTRKGSAVSVKKEVLLSISSHPRRSNYSRGVCAFVPCCLRVLR